MNETSDAEALRRRTKYHFIVGLPRSGSTMLAALLNQNPDVHASGTSAAQIIFQMLYNQFSGASELSALLDDDQRREVMHAVIDAVHHKRGARRVVFDTNRRWLLRAEQLVALYPLCRFVVTVRDPARVVSSLEKARRSLTFRQSRLFDPDTTLTQRVDRLMSPEGIVGNSLNLVQDALAGPLSERMIVIDYDRLLAAPAETMALLYKFLREPAFEHDFEDFSFELPRLDTYLNTPGLHTIRGPLRPPTREMLLPQEMAEKLSKQATAWTEVPGTQATFLL
ncbi:sulfotransferase [Psychromarinibacter sp. C21-152]|uniref:Sulfotransferase n=1 Tax=Psychromarinibacter sediminicola TaxID=3033385 RepID=A0AAE3NQT8_9RHOB|nr:sulfotransferase [Psychromarinibacter sediminicola]MDF0600726.1 sulfotransferase [Psychromarinibacter sediminicola]